MGRSRSTFHWELVDRSGFLGFAIRNESRGRDCGGSIRDRPAVQPREFAAHVRQPVRPPRCSRAEGGPPGGPAHQRLDKCRVQCPARLADITPSRRRYQELAAKEAVRQRARQCRRAILVIARLRRHPLPPNRVLCLLLDRLEHEYLNATLRIPNFNVLPDLGANKCLYLFSLLPFQSFTHPALGSPPRERRDISQARYLVHGSGHLSSGIAPCSAVLVWYRLPGYSAPRAGWQHSPRALLLE